jgi:hypothetical protein
MFAPTRDALPHPAGRCPPGPAALFRKIPVERGVISLARRLTHALAHARVVADQNAPAPAVNVIEDDLCFGGSRHRRIQ